MSEKEFERHLIKDLEKRYPGAIVIKTQPGYIQGFPDRLMLYRDRWAAFEVKDGFNSGIRPNQNYYIRLLNQMSFAKFVYPENLQEVLHELQHAFAS
jgi:hypothetical protein